MAYGHEHGQLDNTNNNVLDLTDKREDNTKLVDFEQVEGTPFTIATQNNEHFILMGKYRISEGIENKEEAIEEAKKINWDNILKVVSVIVEELTQK